MNSLEMKYGCLLPEITIDFEDQLVLIEYAKKLRDIGKTKPITKYEAAYSGPAFVHPLPFRICFKDRLSHSPELANRFDPSLHWEWNPTIDKDVMDVMKQVSSKIRPLFKRFTRCVILLQINGLDIPLHVDSRSQLVKFEKLNRNLCVKIPLTEIQDNNGCPIFEIDGKLFEYKVGNSAFLLNDVDIRHGAKAVEHARGVICFDGILDWDKISAMKKAPIPLYELSQVLHKNS